MVFPYKMDKKDYKILCWSTKTLSSHYKDGRDADVWLPQGFKEIEAAYFVNTQSLGFQYHPEMMFRRNQEEQNEAVKWTQETFLKFINNEL